MQVAACLPRMPAPSFEKERARQPCARRAHDLPAAVPLVRNLDVLDFFLLRVGISTLESSSSGIFLRRQVLKWFPGLFDFFLLCITLWHNDPFG